MNAYLLPGILGLLLGLLLHWAGFSLSGGLRNALGLHRSIPLRSGLTALGWALVLTALLCWLAVIDVDTIEVLPLSFGALAGGALLGIAAGLCGFTSSTAFAGLGAGNAPEALCVLAGCGAMTLLLPTLEGLISPLRSAAPYSAATLFKMTLDEPYLLDGGFLGQGCVGLVLITAALCIPSPKPAPLHEVVASGDPLPPPAATPAPEDAPDETFVALLPGEEPLVVDTELDEEAPEPDPPSASPEEDEPQAEEED